MADWSLLGNFLEEVQEHSTSIGKVRHISYQAALQQSSAHDGQTHTENRTLIHFQHVLFISKPTVYIVTFFCPVKISRHNIYVDRNLSVYAV